jgi:hypothetical protein
VCDAVAKSAEIPRRKRDRQKAGLVNDSIDIVAGILEKLAGRIGGETCPSPKITAGDNESSEHHYRNGNLDTVRHANSSASLGAQRTIQ